MNSSLIKHYNSLPVRITGETADYTFWDVLWFAATEKSDYIQAIGLSSAKFQHLLPQKYPVTFPFQELHHVMFAG